MKHTVNHTPEFLIKKELRDKNRAEELELLKRKRFDPREFITENNIVRISRLPEEEYRLIPGTTRYYVSNMGNALKIVYDKFTDVYLEHPIALMKSKNKTNKTYIDIKIQLDNADYIRCRLSRAIVKTFLDGSFPLLYNTEDKRIAEHIDNNSENNTIDNLRICSQSENIQYAVYEQGCNSGKNIRECYAYNIKTKELRKYDSIGKLCRDIWGSPNPGYFYRSYNDKATTKHAWRVGFDSNEIMNRI